ncbi:TetR/AcrR family transcriptional regulator [Cohnella thailandensis]|uniref:TetR/AcrR family transcriptional regulator n=1 Tax=Cohnella thailandensis TaxID=557557 RepID=A0A841SY56_9BACL|nr:TetR/AcrR family transcriptional regulator [Cohnella thailandensis]MBB6634527.1 TetR/AcrR family transcriptional regulator [Cohnella thailandensis]MBP1972919.1 AcrR family transcriptional regulator [Cohnella thailandensis]
MDRRIKKNQSAIMNALMQLIAEKEFEKITINDIAERADVNRGTVYSHYADKYDLLDKCIEAQLAHLMECCYSPETTGPFPSKITLLRTVKEIENNAPLFQSLLSIKDVSSFRVHLSKMIHMQIVEQMNEHKISLDDLGKSIFAQFMSSAIVGVIEWWFTPSMTCSAEELTERLWSILEVNWMTLLSPQA